MPKRLLGHLAQFRSFSTQSEVLCTQGLAYVLGTYADARSAFVKEVERLLSIKIDEPLRWRAEAVQDDRGRPDLEARATDGTPVVKVEAKLGASLTPGQVQSYVADLERSGRLSVLLVLVPKRRTSEIAKLTAFALGFVGVGPWPATGDRSVAVAVVSWDEVFAWLRTCGGDVVHEVEQLEEMYRVLDGDNIAPVADVQDLVQWRKRKDDFVNLIERATRRLTESLGSHKLLPLGTEPIEQQVPEGLEPLGYVRRYVCPVARPEWSCFCIGVRDSFAKWATPIWLRFNAQTADFALIRSRIEASPLRWLESGGHLWVPLDVPTGVTGEQMVDALVAQAEEVMRVAYGPD
jgi:hypothetical protein